MMTSRYAIVQEKPENIDPNLLQSVLTKQGEMARADATRAARKSRGIITEHLTLPQAAGVCSVLKGHGYAIRVIPTDKLPPIRKVRRAQWMELDKEFLHLPYSTTMTVRAAWTSVFVVNAGRIASLREKERLVETNDFYGSSRGRQTDYEFETEKYSEMVHVTDVIATAENGKLVHLRAPSREFNYARALGADARKRGFFENYLALIEALVQRSTAALVSPETEALLKHRQLDSETRDGEHHVHNEEKRFSQYTRWLLQLVVFREMETQE